MIDMNDIISIIREYKEWALFIVSLGSFCWGCKYLYENAHKKRTPRLIAKLALFEIVALCTLSIWQKCLVPGDCDTILSPSFFVEALQYFSFDSDYESTALSYLNGFTKYVVGVYMFLV